MPCPQAAARMLATTRALQTALVEQQLARPGQAKSARKCAREPPRMTSQCPRMTARACTHGDEIKQPASQPACCAPKPVQLVLEEGGGEEPGTGDGEELLAGA